MLIIQAQKQNDVSIDDPQHKVYSIRSRLRSVDLRGNTMLSFDTSTLTTLNAAVTIVAFVCVIATSVVVMLILSKKTGEKKVTKGGPIRLTIEFNERASEMLRELKKWCDYEIDSATVLRNALLLYHFAEKHRHDGYGISLAVWITPEKQTLCDCPVCQTYLKEKLVTTTLAKENQPSRQEAGGANLD